MEKRTARLKQRMKKEGLDAFLVSNLKNIRYLTGFTGSAAKLFVGRRIHLFTDFRYQEQSKKEVVSKAVIHVIKKGYAEEIAGLGEVARREGEHRIGFESEHISVSELDKYKKKLSKAAEAKIKWVPTKGIVEDMRQVKDPGEVKLISRAARITDEVLAEVIKLTKPGVAEQDLAAEIAYRFLTYTGLEPAFSSIVASGPNSAMPHAKPTTRKLKKGDLVTFDLGAQWKGYSADMTRTFVVGKATSKQKEIYRIVRSAQRKALGGIKAGIKASDADALARDVIKEAGYGSFFGHSLGHGVGLATHDGLRVGEKNTQKIPRDAVITVEPGIYLPGWGGVRIEDLVHVKADGVRTLSSSPRDKLIEL